ncbi:MAG: hypothetical protein GY866_32940 [Proteobacteria bacterium]|nr:hypothetical protein [Pseudomonadota bacterium]
MSDDQIYLEFIEYMKTPIWELTESEHRMPMLRSFLTPEEAAFLTGFPKGNTALEEIAKIKEMDPDELYRKIKPLCKRGVIYESIRGDSRQYRLWSTPEMFTRAPFWSGKGEEPVKSMAYHMSRYYDDNWQAQHKHWRPNETRALPINETVEGGTKNLPYEDVLEFIESKDYFTVSACICRERYRLDPDSVDSPFPIETCLHFDELGRYCVENDMGREITKEETLEILKKCADVGLVHATGNSQQIGDTI